MEDKKQKESQASQYELDHAVMPLYDDSKEHPTPEQLLIRQAVKYLTPKQQAVWESYNYNRLTQDEIAKKLNMGQANVAHSLKAIEKRIAKWVKSNMGSYQLIKDEMSRE